MKRKKTMKQFIKGDKHLPAFMREFDDQKDLFKVIHEYWTKSSAAKINWIDTHCYTIDCFLKFMVYHGYTLQKTNDILTVADLDSDKKALNLKLKEQMESFFSSNCGPTPAIPEVQVSGTPQT